MSIEIRNITKRFGAYTALDEVSLDVPAGELVALLGPSGCGKTTLLRIVAGMERPDAGQVLFHGEDATDRHVRERQVGFVFQHYALFQHMSVFENVAFGLRVRPRATRPPEAEIRERVMKLLALVQLDWLAGRYPAQLSGGQRQRIALARALAVEPRVLLLDEPFGALDTQVRKELRRWLRRLHDEIHVTSVFVTHDQEEALEVADRVVVMNRGHIEQIGTPDEVYEHPATPFVYQFLGNVNLFHGRVHAGVADVGGLRVPSPEHDAVEHAAALAYVRPHDIELSRQPGGGALRGTVAEVRPLGPIVRLEVIAAPTGETVEVEITRERYQAETFRSGEVLYLRPRQLRVFVNPAANAAPEPARDFAI
ncbi:sulfate transport system ATP-binding protein [Plasticicumulans lactativorans]|uniref:Sulfate transport system ATP-binding protein n=1 Tax=Plasticicumulans lactativorans TaxID=1133106 RepID=A0A4R2L9U0_9GAMM|nr:sulfate ABC transporter ATP-binding protein [Plasticicumulans lactativorans]TCO81039.1 sulfate transport system ATP-binding protein [Plasticicumulans lactativorans]